MRSLVAGIGLFIVTAASPAFAADINFRSSAFSGANGKSSFEYTASDGVKLTISAAPAPKAKLYQDSQDGFGVDSKYGYEKDEIEALETLTISFSETVLITDVFLSDLFIEDPLIGKSYKEYGYYRLDNGSKNLVVAKAKGGNGEITVQPDAWASSINFSAPGLTGLFGLHNNEFSVAGLSYDKKGCGGGAVPELDPSATGTAMLLLVGCALLLTDKRRRTV